MKKVFGFSVIFIVMFLLLGCTSSLSKDDIMSSHIEKGSSVELDTSMYTFVRTVDTSFGLVSSKEEVNIISVYLYEYSLYDPMVESTEKTYAYIIQEDKYALKNGASMAVDESKYIIIYSNEDPVDTVKEQLLVSNAEDILNEYRVTSSLSVPTFNLEEVLEGK